MILPSDGSVYAPFDGTVLVMFPTGHAVGIVDDQGCEVLIHVGINTVQLEGKYFAPQVKVGDRVKKGQLLLTFDNKKIQEAGYSTETIVVVSNTKDFSRVLLPTQGKVEAQDSLLIVQG